MSHADTAVVATQTTEVSATGTTPVTQISYQIPANTLAAGTVYHVRVLGNGDTGTAPTFNVALKLGATTLITLTWTPGAGLNGRGWEAEFLMTCITPGASGKVRAGGMFRNSTGGTGANTLGVTQPSSGSDVTINTTVQQTLKVDVSLGASGATMRGEQGVIFLQGI